MNTPPPDATFIAVESLRAFLYQLFARVPIPEAHAQLVADLLIDTDLRGVTSHGVVQVERYIRGYQEGRCNKTPEIEMLKEGGATAALNGDGGLGFIVAKQAMEKAMDAAEEFGIGAATTTYHDHIGSAGKYVRLALQRGLVGVALSGRNAAPHYNHQQTVIGSIQGSPPFCVGAPSGEGQPPFMLDMATSIPWDEALFARMPQIYLKAIGISHVANILSGTLGGQMRFDRRKIRYQSANQSGFFMALQIDNFSDKPAFLADMDHLVQEIAQMQPLPGFDRAELPGGPEWRCEREYRAQGIPIGAETLEVLAGLAAELGVEMVS